MSKKDELAAQLKDLPSGPIADTLKARVVGLLQSCWDELSGSNYTKMEARKLDRAETLKWNAAETAIHNRTSWRILSWRKPRGIATLGREPGNRYRFL